MVKRYTITEWLFALGTYPSFNAQDRYLLFLEMSENFVRKNGGDVSNLKGIKSNNRKKLSDKKKASFASYLEKIDIDSIIHQYKKAGIYWITILSNEYPDQLSEIAFPPIVLFYRGNYALIKQHTWLGVVGARECTSYGLKVLETLIPPLIESTSQSIGIISGLAQGIDTKSHEVCIQAKGSTIGVIGTGLDIVYPSKNRSLQEEMATNQLVISEYPMGAKPLKFHFPERNRIIAGISRGVLVVEAKKRSGSLITAYNAIDENRDIFAVPGSIFQENAKGTHRLIQLGGILTNSSEDILKEWQYI